MAISLEALNAFRPASAWDDTTTLKAFAIGVLQRQ